MDDKVTLPTTIESLPGSLMALQGPSASAICRQTVNSTLVNKYKLIRSIFSNAGTELGMSLSIAFQGSGCELPI